MKVKRFFAKNMQEVLKQVRDDLGPDAVILSNTRVDGGMEIVAALDYEEDAPVELESPESSLAQEGKPSPSEIARMHAAHHLKLQKEMEKAKKRIEDVRLKRSKEGEASIVNLASTEDAMESKTSFSSVLNKEAAVIQSSTKSGNTWDELSDMRSEIMELKELIHEHKSVGSPKLDRDLELVRERLANSLEALCLSPQVRSKLQDELGFEKDYSIAWQKTMSNLKSMIRVKSADLVDQSGVVALVGPTGSGKTTTIGKMAASHVMKYGSEGVALVTTDRYRIAAHEQLKVFGRILNVPVHVVDEHNDLDSILDMLSDKRLVLIDTAGLMHNDCHWSEQMQEIKMSHHDISSYIVVAATGQYQVMCANYTHYKMLGLDGAILTKIDEAVSLGESISFLSDTGLPAIYSTDGQRVPEDLHRINPAQLVEKAEGLLNSSERWVTISTSDAEGVDDVFYSNSA